MGKKSSRVSIIMTGKFAKNEKCECLPKLISVNDASFATFPWHYSRPTKGNPRQSLILDSLSVELGFRITILSGIPDSLSCMPRSKVQDPDSTAKISRNQSGIQIPFHWVIYSVAVFSRFKQSAMRISSLLKDRPRSPLQETCDWIEYVIRHGGARHLRAQVFNIPWYQYYLLDVMAFLVAMVTLVVVVIRLSCTCLCRLCCKRSSDKTKKD